MIKEIITQILLIICTVTDIKYKKISINICLILMGTAILVLFKSEEMKYFLWGIIPGLVLFVIAFISKEKIGYGDVMIVATIGIINGIEKTVMICVISFGLSAVFSIVGLCLKKIKKDDTIPFAPFLFLGNLVSVLEMIL